MNHAFANIAIVNRGEPAMRLIHAVREYNREFATELRVIALYTEPDARAMFVREADDRFCLGEATFIDPADGERKNRYLDYDRLEQALIATGADAVWAGWGFVAEHAAFVELCDRLGVVFIGPDAETIRRLGDKIAAKRLSEKADVPVIPWSGGPVDNLETARREAQRLGFPLMIKASAGGGGRGIRKVRAEAELEPAFASARAEALKAFGDGTVFLEKLVAAARHIEVQIIGDDHGSVWAVGVRDCTIQRRNQKVLEEAPSPALSPEQDRAVRDAAARLGQAAGYRNAGTVEFLFDPERGAFWFMEVNARLQVEHPVTECVTGLDLVKLQLHVARGGKLEGEPPATRGWAIEVRLNAEDPANRFAPAPGDIELLRFAAGPGLRVDAGVAEGDAVPAEFDSMIAKIIAHGRDRAEAMARLSRGLLQTAVFIRGGMTNKSFLLELLESQAVVGGDYDTGWLDRLVEAGGCASARFREIALLQAGLDAYRTEFDAAQERFYAAARRGRPRLDEAQGFDVALTSGGAEAKMTVFRISETAYRVLVDGRSLSVRAEPLGRCEWRLTVGGAGYHVYAETGGQPQLVEVNGLVHRIAHDQGNVVRAPAPAVAVAIHATAGERVAAGDRLVTLEAMKMEMAIAAPYAGIVAAVHVRCNLQVPPGAPLVAIEPEAGVERGAAAAIDFAALEAAEPEPEDALERCRAVMNGLRSVMLGYDLEPGAFQQLLARHKAVCAGARADEAALAACEEEILQIFTDLIALFQRNPGGAGDPLAQRKSSEQYLFAYLLGAASKAMPEPFREKLLRALAHYGVDGLEPSPELRRAMFLMCRSHERMGRQIAPLAAILQRRVDGAALRPGPAGAGLHRLLDRMIFETRGRYPNINDLAHEARFRLFTHPLLDASRERAYADAAAALDQLAAEPEGPDRRQRITTLTACPQPMMAFLSQRYAAAAPALREIILEVMTRRYYRIRQLGDIEVAHQNTIGLLASSYDYQDRHIDLLAVHAPSAALSRAVVAMAARIAAAPPQDDLIADFYLWRDDAPGDEDQEAEQLRALLDRADFARPLRRAVFAISGPDFRMGLKGVRHYTFRAGEDGYREDALYRGLHPMMGKRLEIWRLSRFQTERLPSAEDIYLFRGTARDNSRDKRLFAFAEVRDLIEIRDAEGRLERLPDFERMVLEAFDAIRGQQAHQPPGKRYCWNRLRLFVWPPMGLLTREIRAVFERLAPEADGLGLEKIEVHAAIPKAGGRELEETLFEIAMPADGALTLRAVPSSDQPVEPLTPYENNVVRLRARGLTYPYEILKILTPAGEEAAGGMPFGSFQEYDLDEYNALVPVDRPHGLNRANIVVGLTRNADPRYPDGLRRVALLGDPTRGMGNLAEPECRRIIAGIDLAEKLGLPLEWFAVSAGAKIAMDSGTENMDWIALVLRRIIGFTQAGGELNVVVTGVNVGAQPYWNAEATMLMHTRGLLIMIGDSAMVLTGKQALDYSGGVSAEDNQGIGGYERVMGPNGQAQYFARDLVEACDILLRHYQHSFVASGERFPRRVETADPIDRDIRDAPHGGLFARVGDIFDDQTNPGRKKPFEIRKVMQAVADADHAPLERWFGMQDAEIAVVWDACIGGYPVCLIGIESKPIERLGFLPADGPETWTSGSLFPQASKKIARAVNGASGSRPLVVLANLSGFDGSPESMRKLQLEYGAEIGRAVVNFRGPIVFVVVSRYHGGAFVVFSNKLHDNMEVAALEGAYASVIGGAPAAAVVFARDVLKRTQGDPRVTELEARVAAAEGAEKTELRMALRETSAAVHAEKLGQVAEEFDRIHDIHRAQRVGSVDRIIPAATLRPYLVDAIERGMARSLEDHGRNP